MNDPHYQNGEMIEIATMASKLFDVVAEAKRLPYYHPAINREQAQEE